MRMRKTCNGMAFSSVLDVNCPDCGKPSSFTFAPYVRVETNTDKTYFENSKDFKLVEWRSSGRSFRFLRFALYYPCVSNDLRNIKDLPDSYTANSWRPVRYTYQGLKKAAFNSVENEGVLSCAACPIVRRYILNWPDDAYFQISYKGEILWAYNRDFALSLLDYLSSDLRGNTRSNPFLNSVPTVFQTAKARSVVVRDLKTKLAYSSA